MSAYCNTDYALKLNYLQTESSTKKHYGLGFLFGGMSLLVAGLILGKLIVFKQSSLTTTEHKSVSVASKQTAKLNDEETKLAVVAKEDSPIVSRVAGVSTKAQASDDEQSSFKAIGGTETESSCQAKDVIFSLGQVETNTSQPPADEFNWAGDLEVLPDYPDPFEINVNTEDEFPWRTTLPVSAPININFENQKMTKARLKLGWVVGNQGYKTIAVLLDGQIIGTTTKEQGQMVEGTWQYLKQTTNEFVFDLPEGKHQLTFKPMIESGDAVIWDYIKLESLACDTN